MSDASTTFELLAADPRRRVLFLLCEARTVRVPEDLRTRGRTESPQSPTDGGLQTIRYEESIDRRLEIQLHHNHLPKLEAEDVVEWDREAGIVSRGPAFGEIEPVLRLLAANADRFPDGRL